MIDRAKSIIKTIKSSALFQPQNRWLLRLLTVLLGIVLCTGSYHFMTAGWDGSYSAPRAKGGDYSVIFMFPMAALKSTLLGLTLSAGAIAIVYGITLPRVRHKDKPSR